MYLSFFPKPQLSTQSKIDGCSSMDSQQPLDHLMSLVELQFATKQPNQEVPQSFGISTLVCSRNFLQMFEKYLNKYQQPTQPGPSGQSVIDGHTGGQSAMVDHTTMVHSSDPMVKVHHPFKYEVTLLNLNTKWVFLPRSRHMMDISDPLLYAHIPTKRYHPF